MTFLSCLKTGDKHSVRARRFFLLSVQVTTRTDHLQKSDNFKAVSLLWSPEHNNGESTKATLATGAVELVPDGGGHEGEGLRAITVEAEALLVLAKAAAEGRGEALSEALVHEAVGDGMDAGGEVGQQQDGRLVGGGDVAPHAVVVQDSPGAEGVQRTPAQEVLQHHHAQHLDHTSLVVQNTVVVGRPQAAQHGCCSLAGHGGGAVGGVAPPVAPR